MTGVSPAPWHPVGSPSREKAWIYSLGIASLLMALITGGLTWWVMAHDEQQPDASPLLRWFVLGNRWMEQRRYAEAIDAFTEVLEKYPELGVAYNNRAYARALAGVELDAAIQDIQRALELDGPLPSYLDTRGYLYYLTGQLRKAAHDLDEAIRLYGRQAAPQEVLEHRNLVSQALQSQRTPP